MTKTITFAMVHFSVAFSVAYLITGSIGMAGFLALIEPMVNTVAYFFHEKAWDAYRLRRSKHPQGKHVVS
ncbi:DUF2061 domain-containing protein [Iodobacter fluviatilis]|uniref:DUF2061 domain-containing protein n=1 Tax=Iodobacter fluviatilis TaxID=537 RepID=A0A7G3GB46_9NEIS|nr:DUF2061 domain-containing protein [Iodobacter fluviatilis]QBC44273.1 DUF2061 domain-containing protein [Iodobacter fluviatilis]